MRLPSFLAALLIAIFLTACGGGGGSPGLSSGPNSTFSVAAPTAVTLQLGLSQQYSIRGGVKPYSVFSSDPAVVVGWIGGEDVLSIGTVTAGKATITVIDNKGTKFDIAVTAGSSTGLFTTAPTALTIAPGAAAARTFSVGGGSAPYAAASSDSSVAIVAMNGNSLTVTGLRVGAATISIRDSAGATTLTIAVTVATVPLSLNPTAAQAFVGDVVVSKITGGTPPYRASVGIPDALTATIANGNELTMTYLRLASPVIVTVLDANDQTAVFTATIILGTNRFRLSPEALTISERSFSPVSLTMIGAAPGVSNVFTSDTTLFTATLSGDVVTVTPTGRCVPSNATVTISVVDSKGAIGTATITIQDGGNGSPIAIPAVAASPGTPQVFAVAAVPAGNCPL